MKRNKTVLVAMCVTAVSSWAGNTLSAVNTWGDIGSPLYVLTLAGAVASVIVAWFDGE